MVLSRFLSRLLLYYCCVVVALTRGLSPSDVSESHGTADQTAAFDFTRMRETLDFEVWPPRQWRLANRSRTLADEPLLLSESEPRIFLVPRLASDEDCTAIMTYAASRHAHDGAVGGDDGGSGPGSRRYRQGRRTKVVVVDPATMTAAAAATANDASHPLPAPPAALRRLLARATELTGLGLDDPNKVEAQINSYGEGDFFVPHFDVPSSAKCRRGGLCVPPSSFERGAAARIATILLYLDDVPPEEQGETVFPLAGLAFRPTRGMAIVFNNTIERAQKTGLCEALLGTTTNIDATELRAAAACPGAADPRSCLDICALHAAMPLLTREEKRRERGEPVEGGGGDLARTAAPRARRNVVNVWLRR